MGADMDCAQIKKTLLDGNSLALPEAQRHLEECVACRTLAEDGGELAHFLAAAEPPLALALSGDSFKKLEDQLAREKGLSGRLMSLPTALRELLACTALFIPVAIGVAKLRPDLALYPSVRFQAEIALLAGLAAAAGWVWLRPLHRPRPQIWVVLSILGLGLFVPWLLAALPPAHANQVGVTNNFVYQAAACFLFGTAIALPVMVAVWSLGHRSQGVLGFGMLPAIVAAMAGLIGLELHCPITSPGHLLLGHAPIALALPVLIQLGLGRRR